MIMLNEEFFEKKSALNVSEAQYLLETVMRLKKGMDQIPEPHEARIREIKESIRKGTYLTDEMIDEVAAKMAHIFCHPFEEE